MVIEIPKPRAQLTGASMHGPHHYRCPFCSHVFSFEATHLKERKDVGAACPYCSNHLRIPARPHVVVGPIPRGALMASDRVAFACGNCGEVLRFTAPGSSIQRYLRLDACPHCGSTRLSRAELPA